LPALGADELETLDSLPESFLVFASRLVPYKRLDLAIEIAHKCNQPLVVVGQGPMMASAQAKALQLGAEVIFLGFVSRRVLISVIKLAQAMIFPAIEDFGILVVEAMALGTPVLASSVGGTSETVEHGVSGFLTDFRDPQEAARLVERCKGLDRQSVQETAKKFDKRIFSESIVDWMGVA
jgi:glycosyltransferase involved in cell wall biosynthesis